MPGMSYATTMMVRESHDEILGEIVTATAGLPGYSVAPIGRRTLVLTRRYIPTWALITAVMGAALALVGLLALFIKETDTMTVTVTDEVDGTRISIIGVASLQLMHRIQGVLSGLTVCQLVVV